MTDVPNVNVEFTVFICTYNYAHLLKDALRSLAAQTFTDFELLIVDDGSTDNTEEVVRRHSSGLRNCVYLKKAHTGPADSRNFAVAHAKGTHLASLDSDDLWSPRYLETIRHCLESNPQAELVFTNGWRVLNDGKVLNPILPSDLPPLKWPASSMADLFSLCNNSLPSGMVFRKSLYERVGPLDIRFGMGLGDDVDWRFRAIIAGARWIYLDQKLVLYRFHGGNLTNDPIAFLDPWLSIYERQIKGCRLGAGFERCARNFTRDYVLRLLGICPASRGRSLLARTLKTLPGDFVLRSAYLSTYLGSTAALKLLKWSKHLAGKNKPCKQHVDLSAPPEVIFQSI